MVWDLKVSHGCRQTVQDGCMGIKVAGGRETEQLTGYQFFSLV